MWPCFGFYVGATDLNSSPCVCIASALTHWTIFPGRRDLYFILLFCNFAFVLFVFSLGVEQRPSRLKGKVYTTELKTQPQPLIVSPLTYIQMICLRERKEKLPDCLRPWDSYQSSMKVGSGWSLLPVWRSLEIPISHSPDILESLGFVDVIYFLSWTCIVRCVPNIKSSLDDCLHCRLRILMRILPKQIIFLCSEMRSGRRGNLIYIWMLWFSCLPWSCM